MTETTTKAPKTMINGERDKWSREQYEQDRARLVAELQAAQKALVKAEHDATAAFAQEQERHRRQQAEWLDEAARMRRTIQERDAKIADQARLLKALPEIREALRTARQDAKHTATTLAAALDLLK